MFRILKILKVVLPFLVSFHCFLAIDINNNVSSTTEVAESISPETLKCPDGWKNYSSNCYYVIHHCTFYECEAMCQTMNAHLVSIHSDGENVFVNDFPANGDPIGDYDILLIGLQSGVLNWTWTDGTTFDYKHWTPSEPNNSTGKRNCVVTNTVDSFLKIERKAHPKYYWDDTDCTSTTVFRTAICKQPVSLHPFNPSKTSTLSPITSTTTVKTTSNPTTTSLNFNSSTTMGKPSKTPKSFTIWFIVGGGFLIVFVIISLYVLIRFTKKRREEALQTRIQKSLRFKFEKAPLHQQLNHNERLKWQLDPKNVIVDFNTVLGRGSNATVYEAEIKQHLLQHSNYLESKAALKLPTNFDADELQLFVRELDALVILGSHSHIITLLGWSLHAEIPTLITEKAEKNLLTYVKSFRGKELPYRNILSILWQISQALEHVAANLMVHRDVAARNILLTKVNVAKLADFGLCCHADESLTYRSSLQKRFPLRWLSIEALTDRLFSDKSDVWSFGILMYEIFTHGSVPYSSLTNVEMLEFLKAGKRLEKPLLAPGDIYDLMLACWAEDPGERPSFKEIGQFFRKVLEDQTAEYGYLLLGLKSSESCKSLDLE